MSFNYISIIIMFNQFYLRIFISSINFKVYILNILLFYLVKMHVNMKTLTLTVYILRIYV